MGHSSSGDSRPRRTRKSRCGHTSRGLAGSSWRNSCGSLDGAATGAFGLSRLLKAPDCVKGASPAAQGHPLSRRRACMLRSATAVTRQPAKKKPAAPKKHKQELNVQNKRARKKEKQEADRKNIIAEFACAPNSTLRQLCEDYQTLSVRHRPPRCKVIDQLNGQMEGCEGRPNLRSSIPCTSGSPWQYVNRSQYGAAFRAKLLPRASADAQRTSYPTKGTDGFVCIWTKPASHKIAPLHRDAKKLMQLRSTTH